VVALEEDAMFECVVLSVDCTNRNVFFVFVMADILIIGL
jgi:hypothetical protein